MILRGMSGASTGASSGACLGYYVGHAWGIIWGMSGYNLGHVFGRSGACLGQWATMDSNLKNIQVMFSVTRGSQDNGTSEKVASSFLQKCKDSVKHVFVPSTKPLEFAKDAEVYYLLGLEIKPDHNGINEYLGELYVQTNQIENKNN